MGNANAMVYSFTESSSNGSGMLCYQTAAKGEPTLENLLTVTTDDWHATTGEIVDESCGERDDDYGGATKAKAVLRAAGLPWQETPLGASLSGTSLPSCRIGTHIAANASHELACQHLPGPRVRVCACAAGLCYPRRPAGEK